MRKIDILVLLFILIFSCITLKDLFKPGFYSSHDGINQIVRLYYFDDALRDGQIPPRWAGGLLNGFGYPLFIFSYHFPWFIGEALHLSGLSIIDSIKMTFLIAFIFSGFFMYFYQKELFSRLAAFAGTMIYLMAPNRFLNIFVRAAIGDATAYIFPPILFLSVLKMREGNHIKGIWVILGSVALASLLLSHAMVFFFFFLVLILYIVIFFFSVRHKKTFFVSIFLMITSGIGLSGYYLFPSLIERSYTNFSSTMSMFFGGNTFLTLKELVYSPWGYGAMHSFEGGMSFQLGIAQWIVGLLSFVIIIFKFIKRKYLNIDLYFFFFIFLFSLFLMLPASSFFWAQFQKILFIDFTWRIFPLAIFAISILAGATVKSIRQRNLKFVLAFLLIIIAIYSNRNHIRINESLTWDVDFYKKLVRTTNQYDEYTPKWVYGELVQKEKPKVEFPENSAQIQLLIQKSNFLKFKISNSKSGLMRINTIYYPGWILKENNREVTLKYDNGGLISYPIEKGSHIFELSLQETELRKISDIISILFIGGTVLFVTKQLLDKLFIKRKYAKIY